MATLYRFRVREGFDGQVSSVGVPGGDFDAPQDKDGVPTENVAPETTDPTVAGHLRAVDALEEQDSREVADENVAPEPEVPAEAPAEVPTVGWPPSGGDAD